MRVAPSGDESAAGDDVMHGLTLLRTDGAAEEHRENVVLAGLIGTRFMDRVIRRRIPCDKSKDYMEHSKDTLHLQFDGDFLYFAPHHRQHSQ